MVYFIDFCQSKEEGKKALHISLMQLKITQAWPNAQTISESVKLANWAEGWSECLYYLICWKMWVLHQRFNFPSLVWWCVGAFHGHRKNHFLSGMAFYSCSLNNTKGFHGRMFSSCASSSWSVDYTGWKWRYCLWACCSTASDSFGETGDDCFTIRGKYWDAERSFLYSVIKFFTKGKQKGQIRGKQLLEGNSMLC